ncbi:HNH endonuclease [Enterobacter pseudoroggenkampii]|uniref:HNH endonuclease n=1 Tax=Enterobacter pseudoroggenkampii TaxID=2996112 RepID=UPI002263E1BE|nr:HNH endonuclease [Enterobacter pseudoroggenkampii]MCX8289124.1 HNH endonuclease [Enterobacter pseudoroggenkampii]
MKTFDGVTYDPVNGAFYGRTGKLLKRVSGKYQRIDFLGKSEQAHRVAWYIMKGEFPSSLIDHINRDKHDNRWCNLRLASKAENNRNTDLRKDNVSGHKGVCWRSGRNKWLVQIGINGKVKHLGNFDDFELACLVADEARNKYHGDFAS